MKYSKEKLELILHEIEYNVYIQDVMLLEIS